ncbi:MAG: hypothetical protein J6U54_17730 [Clostridiales bacterium]|nr:hypothetical protein [Clostridiales bacterium]
MKENGIIFSLRGYDIREYEYQSGKENKTVKAYRITDEEGMKGNPVIVGGKTYLTLQEAINEVFLRAIEDILDTHDDKLLNLKQQVKGLEKRLNKAKEIDYLEKRLAEVKEEIDELRDAATDMADNQI